MTVMYNVIIVTTEKVYLLQYDSTKVYISLADI